MENLNGENMDSDYILKGDIHSLLRLPADVTRWDAELTPVEAGEINSDVLVFKSGPLLLTATSLSKTVYMAGEGPAGCRSFVVCLGNNAPISAYGVKVTGDELLAFPTSQELGVVLPRGIFDVNISFEADAFEEMSGLWGCEGVFKKLEHGGAFRPTPHSLSILKGVVLHASAILKRKSDTSILGSIRRDIQDAIATCFIESGSSVAKPAASERRIAIRKALEFIWSQKGGDVSLADIREASGVSERTLLYAFKQELGISPKAYLKNYRLYGAYQDLVERRGKSVTAVARRWGFWHMSQFGVDYKRLFGELPSITLRRLPKKVCCTVPAGIDHC